MFAVDAGVNRVRHSPSDIGGVDATSRRRREASFNGADGVVRNGTLFKKRIPKHCGSPDRPVCAAAVASHLLLMAQPPLLFQEGSGEPHTHS
jgi:hypothetical protein